MHANELKSPRREIAETLAQYYAELASIRDAPQPAFSLVRVVEEMANGGLRSGREREVCTGAALAGNAPFDPQRVTIPWGALVGRRDLTAASAGLLVGDAVQPAQDALAPWSVAARAGAVLFSNSRENLQVPRVATELAGGWLASDGVSAASPSQPTLGTVSLVPHTFAAIVRFSRQFLRQSAEAEAFIRRQLLQAAGRALDRAVLQGSGVSGEPLGLSNDPSVAATSGAAFAITTAAAMRATVGANGADDSRLVWIGPPAVRQVLAARAAFTNGGAAIWAGDTLDGRPAFVTPDAAAATLYLGDFSRLAIAMFGAGPTLLVDPYSNFDDGRIDARVLLTADCGPLQAGAFALATGIS